MKKLAVLVMITGMLIIGSSSVFAYAVGGKLIYNKMMDDYADVFDNNLSGGVFFDVGPVFFKARFRPGLDWVDMESDAGLEFRAYGIHLDWYWFLMPGKSFNPFLGFGPALNYYNFEDDRTDGDSDAGIEGYGGFEFNFSGPWSLMVEARLVIHDIADFGTRIFKPSVGVVYYF